MIPVIVKSFGSKFMFHLWRVGGMCHKLPLVCRPSQMQYFSCVTVCFRSFGNDVDLDHTHLV